MGSQHQIGMKKMKIRISHVMQKECLVSAFAVGVMLLDTCVRWMILSISEARNVARMRCNR